MAGKKSSNKGSPKGDTRSEEDRKKGLRQGKLTVTKTSELSLITPAEPVSADNSPPSTGGLHDDSISLQNSPSNSQEHQLLQPHIAPHLGVGVTDPDLQPTYDDPIHLTFPPPSWEEMERNEADRRRMASQAPDDSSSQLTQEDNSSPSTAVEDVDTSTTPASKMQEMELKIQQLQATVSGLTQRLEQEVTAAKKERDSLDNAVTALAGDCRATHVSLTTQEDSISQLQQQTGTLEARLEDTEQKINSNIKRLEVVVDSVTTLQTTYNSLQERMDAISDEFQRDRLTGATGGTAAMPADTCETGVFISGVPEISKYFRTDLDPFSDPVTVIGRLMKEIDCYHAINRIFIADKAVSRDNRHEARAVIVYLNSVFYKRQVTVLLKRLLEKKKLRVTVSDVFSAEETPRALALSRLAAEKRQDNSMTRTRVINRNGTAVLQHTNTNSSDYKDVDIPDEDLEPYFQPRTGRAAASRTGGARTGDGRGRVADRRDRRDRNGGNTEREMRDQEKASRRNNNSNHNNSNHNNGAIPRNHNSRRANSPPVRLSTPNMYPVGPQCQPPVPQPATQLYPQQQQLALHRPDAGLYGGNVRSATLHSSDRDLSHHYSTQQQRANNNSMMAAQQRSQGADSPSVINPMQVNTVQNGFLAPMQPQMAAFLQKMLAQQQFQQQLYTTDNNGQQLLMQQSTANNTTREGY